MKYGRGRSLLGQLFDEQPTVFGRQLKDAVRLVNPLVIRIHEAEDRSGFAIVTSEFSRNILKRKYVAFSKYQLGTMGYVSHGIQHSTLHP